MSLHEYTISRKLSADDPPFYALIMAAMRQADTINFLILQQAWPDLSAELKKRYNAPGGCLNDDDRAWLVRWEEGL